MLKSLFRPSWKSKSADKRLRFIADIDSSTSANQTTLQNLATSDVDIGVRHAAMAKVSSLQSLYDFSESHKDSESRQFAETTFRNLLQSSELPKADLKTFIASNPKANLLVAKYCPDAELRDEMLMSLDESEQADVIADVPYSATRVMLAEKIQSIGALEVARKSLKGRDKNAEKIIKAKIDSIHAKQKLDGENAALAQSIREKMEALSRYIAWSDEIRVKFFNLTKSWDSLAFDPSGVEKALYNEAFTKVSAEVKQNMAITLSEQSQAEIVSELEAKCISVAAYSLDKLLLERSRLNDDLRDLSWQWDKEGEVTPHPEGTLNRFNQASKALKSAINIAQSVSDFREVNNGADAGKSDTANQKAKAILQVAEQSNWPNNLPTLTSANEATAEAKAVLDSARESRKQAKDALDGLHKKIGRIFGAANRGDLNRAQRELKAAVNAASHYEGKDRKHLDERIQEATDAVGKMGDWKDFAIEPKLVDLCEQMETLANTGTPSADKQAVKIKKLQEAWKALGSSGISDNYWPRFKEAADKAYEPCSVFFKERRKTQRENLQKREPLLSEMKDLLESTDWDAKPDYKAVEDSLLQIMRNWKKVKDVEHGPGQKQWDKLGKVKDQINQKLSAEYDSNITAKHSLTAQLGQMLEQDVTEQTLEKLQFIQGKWKQIGVTRRAEDQKAWVSFKQNSDAVYQKIQDLRQAKRSGEDEQVAVYKAVHAKIHALARSAQDLGKSDEEFDALQVEYKTLPSLPTGLPEKLVERLGKEYTQACDAYEGAKDRLDKAKFDNELEALVAKARLCSELEQLPEQADEAEVLAIQDKINSLEMSNKNYSKRFAKRLRKARDTDRAGYSAARRMLLIESEILLDVESPEEDKSLRLQTQLDRMKQQGIGQGSADISASMSDLKVEWLCMPGAEAKLQEQFDERFSRLIQ